MSNFPLSKVAEQRIDGKLQIFPSNIKPIFRSSLEKKIAPSDSNGASHLHLLRIEPNILSKPTRTAAGAMFARDKPPKKCTGLANVAGPSITRRHFQSDTAATLARLGCSLGQQGHNFSPTWTQLAPISAQLGCKIAQLGPTWSHLGYGFKLGDIASLIHSHSPQNAQFRWSKKVLKSNFRQYARMEKQTWKRQRRDRKKRENQRRERVRRKKVTVCEKAKKSQNTVFSQRFVAPDAQEVGSLKRRHSHLVR